MKTKLFFPFPLAIAALILLFLLSLAFGAVSFSFSQLWQALLSGPDNTPGVILWYTRFPRACAAVLAGSALAVSGCILQHILQNQLASPNIIGVNAGAGLAVTLCCAFGLLSGWVIPAAAFIGALAAVLLILLLARKTGASGSTVILAGVALNSVLTALRDALASLYPDAAVLNAEFRVGGFSAVTTEKLLPAAILILLSLIIVFLLHNELEILSLGDETAQSLGLPVRRTRFLFLVLAALLAGSAVCFAGLLGFVGLLVPHFARKVIGNDCRRLLPFSALSGAVLVLLCDLLSRVLFAPHEFYVGILMSILGGPVFLILLLKKRGEHLHA